MFEYTYRRLLLVYLGCLQHLLGYKLYMGMQFSYYGKQREREEEEEKKKENLVKCAQTE